MLYLLGRNWWLQLFRGILAIVFGGLFLTTRGDDFALLTMLVGAFAFADGMMSTIIAVSSGEVRRGRVTMLALGLFQVAIGLVVLFWPGQTETSLATLFAAWCVVTGVVALVGADAVRKVRGQERVLTTLGVLTIGFGLYLIVAAHFDTVGPGIEFGAIALAIGVLLLAASARLRRLHSTSAFELDVDSADHS